MEKQTMNYDELFAGDFPAMPIEITVGKNQKIKRGDLLVKDLTSKTFLKATKAITATPAVSVAEDVATVTPADICVVAAEDVTTEDVTTVSTAYCTGEFNKTKIGFGGESKLEDNYDALLEKKIFLR